MRRNASRVNDMKIIETYQDIEPYTEVMVTEIAKDGEPLQKSEAVITEHEIDLYIREIRVRTLSCTPTYLTELVLGCLLSEGMIQSVEDVDTVSVCEQGKKAEIRLCGNGENGGEPLKPVIPIRWEPAWIWTLTKLLGQDTPLHRRTHSVHSCCLMIQGDVVFQCEDIGRHNTLDKAAGYALRQGYDLKNAVIYITGRVPADMVIKAIRCGIPVIVSKEAPTREAIRLAGQYRLTLVGCAKNQTAKLFTQGAGSAFTGAGSDQVRF